MQKFAPQRGGIPRNKRAANRKQFDRFTATELYCPKCRQSMPVRERLLLVLPEGEKYEYLCARCGTSVGDKIVKGEPQPLIVI
ncbi:MAG TPA: cytoplasmic protein [Desulfomonilaceae bacterium]|nr:cytoplasmic protein [Desulfomonilaceae bacterium]